MVLYAKCCAIGVLPSLFKGGHYDYINMLLFAAVFIVGIKK